MFETMVQFVLGDHLGGLTFDPPEGPPGYARLLAKERRPFATKDGYICTLIYNDKQWKNFFALIGQPELFDNDPRFADLASRTLKGPAVKWSGRTTRVRDSEAIASLFPSQTSATKSARNGH